MTEFVVAGAGIAGLATAVGLQALGHEVVVLEERTDTSTGAAISLWPNALAALDRLGLGDAVRAVSTPIDGGAVRRSDGRVLRRVPDGGLSAALGEPVHAVRRSVLVSLLAARLRAGTVRTDAAVRAVETRAAGVRVRLASGDRVDGGALIGADGTRSVVARHLNGPLADRYAGYPVWLGIADVGLDAAQNGLTVGSGIELGHLALDHDHTYWFAALRAPEGSVPGSGAAARLARAIAGWSGPGAELVAATPAPQLLCLDLYDRERARAWHRGPVVLVGDAAHPMRPHLGQGGAQSLEDAATLVTLVERERTEAAFARYVAVRRRRAEVVVRLSRWIGRMATRTPDGLVAVGARAGAAVPDALALRPLAAIAGRDVARRYSTSP